MAEEISYTQEQLNEAIENAKKEWIEKEYNPIKLELEEVKTKLPKELSDEEKAIKAKQQELFEKEVELELRSAGLEQFKDIVEVSDTDELKKTINQLNKVVNDMKLSLGYVPEDHKQVTTYQQAKSKGDTKGMIKSLFGF